MVKSSPLAMKNESRNYYALQPWKCRSLQDRMEILAYVEASGKWETVAVVPTTSGASAENVANFIVRLINDTHRHRDLYYDAMEVLETIMHDGVNFSTEQAADSVLARMKIRVC